MEGRDASTPLYISARLFLQRRVEGRRQGVPVFCKYRLLPIYDIYEALGKRVLCEEQTEKLRIISTVNSYYFARTD